MFTTSCRPKWSDTATALASVAASKGIHGPGAEPCDLTPGSTDGEDTNQLFTDPSRLVAGPPSGTHWPKFCMTNPLLYSSIGNRPNDFDSLNLQPKKVSHYANQSPKRRRIC